MNSFLELKIEVYKRCVDIVDEKILRVQEGISNAQEAANNEGKSSMGDKYETGRAMMHLEKDKMKMQLGEIAKMKRALGLIKIQNKSERTELGCLVLTSSGSYFLAISIGLLEIVGEQVFVISPMSPVGQLLLGKKVGDCFEFYSQKIEVLGIE